MSSIFEKLAAQAVHSALEKQASGPFGVKERKPALKTVSGPFGAKERVPTGSDPVASGPFGYKEHALASGPFGVKERKPAVESFNEQRALLEALKASLAGVGESIGSRFSSAKDYARKKYNDINNSETMQNAKDFARAHKKGLIITGAGGALGTGGLAYGLSGKKDQAGDVAMGAGDAMGGGAGTPVTMPESGDTPFYKNPKYMIPAGLALGGLGLLGTGAYLSSSKKKKKRRSQDDDE